MFDAGGYPRLFWVALFLLDRQVMQQVKIDNRPSLKNTGDGPKVAVTVGVQEILLSMSKIQYQSL